MIKRRAHWSLKTKCGILPSNIACKQKITSGPSFFKAQMSVLSLTAYVDVMAELEDFFDESI